MYYTYFSTGNVSIDSEHANIDMMIDLCRKDTGDWIPKALFLISAIAHHLDSEEKICLKEGLNMTDEHLDEHRMLKSRLGLIKKSLHDEHTAKDAFLDNIRDILFYHISNFDKHLCPR